jgi:uncharacterized membrane protein
MPIQRLRNFWENAQTSLWFIPSMCVATAVLMSIILPEVDKAIEQEIAARRDLLFSGSASAGRTILSAIAGSVVTVVAVVFSITIVALQQASTQFTPRIMGAFTRDRGNQIVLGMYLATFAYSILVLRQVRGEDSLGEQFIPTISITVAILLAVICLGLLVYFIHHAASQLQAATVINHARSDLLASIERLYPEGIGNPPPDDDTLVAFQRQHGHGVVIPAPSAGYLRAVDAERIVGASGAARWAIVVPRVGSYLVTGQPLLELDGRVAITDERREQLQQAFVLDVSRSLHQDAMFGLRQLADIAIKALSPSVNDPTTAEHAISAMADGLAILARREIPRAVRELERDEEHLPSMELLVNRPDFAAFVNEGFDQVRRYAASDTHVLLHLTQVLTTLAYLAPDSRQPPIRAQIEALAWQIAQTEMSPRDEQLLHDSLSSARSQSRA